MVVQFDGTPTDFKPMSSVGAGAYEVRVRIDGRMASHLCRQVRRRGLRSSCVSEKDAENQQRRYRPRRRPLQTNRRQAMKKTDPRIDDTRITESSGNVFVDLGFDEAEAKVMALRVELIVQLRETLTQQGLTQAEAAKQLGVTQPRVSALLKGTWKDFSIDMLLTFAARLGLQPRLMFVS